MTEKQRQQIFACRENGMTITETAKITGVSVSAIKSYLSRKTDADPDVLRCKYCGAALTHTEGHKEKHFCNQSCYFRWRYAQGDLKRTEYKKKCAYCGKTFTVRSNKCQKYCSADCYQAGRRAGGEDE